MYHIFDSKQYHVDNQLNTHLSTQLLYIKG